MADPSALFYAVSATIVPSDDLSLAEIEEVCLHICKMLLYVVH